MAIPINLALEDALTESLTTKILATLGQKYATRTIYNRGGYGYLQSRVRAFNNAAKGIPFLVATDLDRYNCPPELIADWLPHRRHHNLLIRVAVREAEAWILADSVSFADFLGIDVVRIPIDVEAIPDPKRVLVRLARGSRRRELREDICPPAGSTRLVGPNYNPRLGVFVAERWNPRNARLHAPSLDRAIRCLEKFEPEWGAA